jgi:bacterioferritin
MMLEQQGAPENFFLKDVLAIREQAQGYLATSGERAGADTTIALLQSVLSAEIVCVLRYTMVSVSHDGLENGWIGAEFQEQANDERKHMQMAAERIRQLGGTPDFNPQRLASRSAALHACNDDFTRCVNENLAAERGIIEYYRDLIAYFSGRDPETCDMLQAIVRDEEDHGNDMQDLLATYIS